MNIKIFTWPCRFHLKQAQWLLSLRIRGTASINTRRNQSLEIAEIKHSRLEYSTLNEHAVTGSVARIDSKASGRVNRRELGFKRRLLNPVNPANSRRAFSPTVQMCEEREVFFCVLRIATFPERQQSCAPPTPGRSWRFG